MGGGDMSLKENVEYIKIVLETLKREQLSAWIILSILLVPGVIWGWKKTLPEFLGNWVAPIVVIIWLVGSFIAWRESTLRRRKTRLLNYLIKKTRKSLYFLRNNEETKDDFSDKTVYKLLSKYPDVFMRVDMGEHGPGVCLTDEEIKRQGLAE